MKRFLLACLLLSPLFAPAAPVESKPPLAASPTLSVTISGNDTFCPDGGTVLSSNVTGAVGAVSYQWRRNGNNISGATGTTYTATQAGDYTLRVTDASPPNATSNAISVSQSNLNATAITGPNEFCAGSSTTLTANRTGGTGPFTYQWKLGANNAPGTSTNATYQASQPGSYTVVITDSRGCTDTSPTRNVTQNPAPTVTVATTSDVICSGGSVNLTATPGSGTPPYSYQWKRGATNVGPNSASYNNVTTAGSYTVVVTDNNGCTVTSAAVVIATSNLAVQAIGGTAEFCAGSNTTLSANFTGGNDPYTYQWRRDGNVVGGNTSTLNVNTAGSYTVRITDSKGCFVESPARNVTQNPLPTANAGPGGTFTGTQTYSLAGVTTGSGGTGGLSFSWSTNPSVPISPIPTNATPTIGPFTQNTAVNLTVTDSKGCQATSSAAITFAPCTVTASVAAPATDVLCSPGQTIALNATAGGGTPAYTYQWKKDGANVGTNSSTYTVDAAGSYTVTITDSKGCAATSAARIITQSNLAVGTPGGTAEFCAGASTTLTANPTGGTGPYAYQWKKDGANVGTNAATLSVNAAGSYTVVVTDAKGCSVTSAARNVTQNPVPSANAGPGGTFTGTETYSLAGVTTGSGTNQPLTYAWSTSTGGVPINNPAASNPVIGPFTQSTTVQLTVTDSKGCQATSTSAISFVPCTVTASVAASPSQVICTPGQTITLTATAGGGNPAYTYQWKRDGQNTGTNAPTLNVTTAGSYTVTVTDTKGCAVTPAATVITQSTLATGTPNGASEFCANTSITLTANQSGGVGPFTYQWRNGGNNVGSNANTLNVNAAGSYSVIITDSQGCTVTSGPKAVAVNPVPSASAGPGKSLVCNEDYNLTGVTTGAGGTGGLSYAWSTSPGVPINNASAANPIIGPFPDVRNYTVNLTVTDSKGCQATSSAIVTKGNNPLSASINAPFNTICPGATVTITSSVNGNSGGPNYQWQNNNNDIGGQNGSQFVAGNAGNYRLVVTDNRGCRAESNTIGLNNSNLNASISSSTNFRYCEKGQANFARLTVNPSGGAGSYQYRWNNANNQSIQTIDVFAGFYSVTVTDAQGCQFRTADVEVFALQRPKADAGPGIVLTGDEKYDLTKFTNYTPATGGRPSYSYRWTSAPDTAVKATVEKPILGEFTRTNIVSLIVTDANGCVSDPDTATVRYLPCQLTNRIVGNNYVCNNNTTLLTANAANGWGEVRNYRYQWRLGTQALSADSAKLTVTRGGLYAVTAIDTRGCRRTDTIQVAQLPELLVSVSGPASYCRGSNESLVARVQNGAPRYVFEWRNGEIPLAGDSARYFLQGGGTYLVKVTDSRGCTGVLAQPITVVEKGQTLSAVVIPPNGPTTVYAPATVKLAAQTGPDYTYQWMKDNKEIAGATTPNYEVTPQKDPGKANYAIRVGNTEGCFATSAALTVEVIIPTAVGPVKIGEFAMSAFPSPTSGRIQVNVSLEKPAPATFHLTDLKGRTLTTRVSPFTDTRHTAEFDLSTQPNGLYLLRVEANGEHTVQKVVKAN